MKQLSIISFALLTLAISSCKKPKDQTPAEEGYLIGYRTAGNPTADYLLTSKDLLTGTISATGTGIELSGWNYYGKAGSTYFAIDYTNNICVGYKIENGQPKEKGQFAFERMDCMTEADENTMIAIGAPWGGGSYDCRIQKIDAANVSIGNTKYTPVYVSYDSAGAQLNAWPTHSYIQGGKLFVAFYPLNGVSWDTPKTDTAYVSVFSYPGLDYLHTFKDTRTGPIGYYGGSPAMVEDEAGNHYTLSTSSIAGGFTQATKPSGILKINNGQEQFDASYFFNIEALGYRLLTAAYAGNGKVVARVVPVSTDAGGAVWAAFDVTNAICKAVVLDLNAKTLTEVSDVPLHGGQYQTPFLVENGKVLMSVNNGTEAYIYAIDPNSASATKGARIEGSELQSFFKY
jgi:hypothetical protein